jgi:glutamate carboxypeptidase
MTKARAKRRPTDRKKPGAPPSPSVGVGGIRRLGTQRSTTGKLSELIRYLETRQLAMVQSIRHMVEMESPSQHKKSVDLLGERLGQAFHEVGGTVHFHPTAKFGAHLQIDFAADPKRPPVLLLGHFDTVWDLGTLSTMPFREADGRLWGPGVLDMKSGIAQMIFAIEALSRVRGKLPRPVSVLLVTDEEVGSDSSRPITESIAKQCGAVLVIEPSYGLEGALKTARKGVGDYTLKVRGRAAHAGLDFEKGASAILELSRQLLEIAKFTDLKKGITVNAGVIRGGTRGNVIPDEAEADIDLRIAAVGQAKTVDRKFRSLKPFDSRCQLEITGGINRPPLERSEKVVKLFRTAQKITSEIGWHLDEASVGGGSDGNFTAGLGIPTLDGLGAVGEGAHARNESVLISELVRRTALLARLIEEV